MATLSTNTAPATHDLVKTVRTMLARLIQSLRPTLKTPEDHLAAAQRREAARARVDHLLR